MIILLTAIITVIPIYPVYTANILAVFPHSGISHHMVFLPYLRALANRGHNLTFISNYPSEHSNITDISIMGTIPILNYKKSISDFEPMNNIRLNWNLIWSFYVNGKKSEAMFTVDNVKRILNGRFKYDLLITEHFNSEISLVFASKFNIPFILMSSCNLLPWTEQVMGQPHALTIRPATLINITQKMNFYDRVINTISTATQILGWEFLIRKRDEDFIKQNLNTDVSLDELVSNASLVLTNTHFTMFESRPFVPAVVEVGGIHIQPIKPLPADIQKYIDEAEHGVIYFCMGSMLRGETFPTDKRQMFLNVFKKIPQRVLWKWEGELPGGLSNVMIRKWMPQRDILGHPNVKLFISHGGLLGTTEAVYEGVPILSIPMFGDQMTNINAVMEKGAAEMMSYSDLNEDEMFAKVTSMVTNPIYKQKAKKLSETFRDRPMSPMETAIYWTEYVIRHKGAPHLRSAAVGMPWYKYYLVDVLFVILSSLTIFILFLYYLIFKVILRLSKKEFKEKQA